MRWWGGVGWRRGREGRYGPELERKKMPLNIPATRPHAAHTLMPRPSAQVRQSLMVKFPFCQPSRLKTVSPPSSTSLQLGTLGGRR